MSESQINTWLKQAVKNENFCDYTVQIHGNSGKSDGYIGKIQYLTITGKTKTNQTKTLNLVLKTSSQSAKVRSQFAIKKFFEKEIHIYDRVVPQFEILQKEAGVDLLDFVPKCYATKLEENNIEMVILDNLKPKGYDLWDRKVPMTSDHFTLILQNFGKWHAFSMVLRRRKPEIFAKLVENNVNIFPYHIFKVGMFDKIFDYFEEGINSENSSKYAEIKQLKITKDEAKRAFLDLFEEDSDYRIILHGDSWTNNFLFKQDDRNKPIHVVFIDWQCSGLASPVMDLSFFIYTCVDTKIYNKVQDLLKIYYSSFKETVDKLNCNPDEIFSFEKLEQHWKKFSLYGIVLGNFVLNYTLCEAEDAPDLIANAEQGKEFIESLRFTFKNKEVLYDRATNNLLHYIRNLK